MKNKTAKEIIEENPGTIEGMKKFIQNLYLHDPVLSSCVSAYRAHKKVQSLVEDEDFYILLAFNLLKIKRENEEAFQDYILRNPYPPKIILDT